MKMIIAVIRPEKVQNVKDALKEAGIRGLTITPVRGRGSQGGLCFTTRTEKVCIDEIEKVKLEIVVDDDKKQTAVDTVREYAATGTIGDGRIFVVNIEESYKVNDEPNL
ncbi:MAG: P-II family nitrogen regulator [Candidatus Methanoplasma sp.]|jgi:nitrogen regulatory protein P-II 1|nr:P-II family nitrogen regulator [Candidatus Methanoplasma sp.]